MTPEIKKRAILNGIVSLAIKAQITLNEFEDAYLEALDKNNGNQNNNGQL